MPTSSFAWTECRVAELRRLWAGGLSASQIAAALGCGSRNDGPSRNAVIGKIHRLGLSGRVKPSRPKPTPSAEAAHKRASSWSPPRVKPRSLRVPPPPPSAIARAVHKHAMARPERGRKWRATEEDKAPSAFVAPGRCPWIDGNPADEPSRCGAPSAHRHGWCAAHAAIVYPPQQGFRPTMPYEGGNRPRFDQLEMLPEVAA
jgi:GcrA cell cycle regulator